MATSYSENNKRETIFEPLLSRQRFAYKGPVSSAVVNLTADQFLMDINRLDKKTEHLQDMIDISSEMSRNNMNLATPDSYVGDGMLMTIYSQYISWDEDSQDYIVESATPYYNQTLEFNKPQINAAIIAQLNRKLDIIEGALKDDN